MPDFRTMTDIKPELIERAAQALDDMRARRSWAFHEIGQPLGDTVYDDERRADARAALEAVADDLRAEGAAQALRDAAEAFGENQMIREGDAKEWLRARADRIGHVERCPHSKCPGGSLCCCPDADRIEAGSDDE